MRINTAVFVMFLVLLVLIFSNCDNVFAVKPHRDDPHTVMTPEFKYLPGTYSRDLQIMITTRTAGAKVYYSYEPDAHFIELYADQSIEIKGDVNGSTVTKTIYAYAVKDGMIKSATIEGTFTVNYDQVSMPNFSIKPGLYEYDIVVKITTSPDDANIYYAIDQNGLTGAYLKYDKPAEITGNGTALTIRAYAEKAGMVTSDTASGKYMIDYYIPKINPLVSSPQQLPAAKAFFGTALFGNKLYIIGDAEIFLAVIDESDGSIGIVEKIGSMTQSRWGHACVIHNGYLYIIGGCFSYTGGSYIFTNAVSCAKINTDGSLGVFKKAGEISTPRSTFGCAVYNNFLYITGGISGNNAEIFHDDVQYAQFNPDGTISDSDGNSGKTSIARFAISNPRADHKSFIHDGYVYVIGGKSIIDNNFSILSDMQYAPVYPDGSIGEFEKNSAHMASEAMAFGYVIYHNYLILIGGMLDRGFATKAIQYAKINEDNTIGEFALSDVTLPTQRYGFSTIVYNDFMYIIGGHDSMGNKLFDIKYSKIESRK